MKKSLKTKLEKLPRKPGIYFFKNAEGDIIYIGKARSIRDRVKSYFQATADAKVKNILAETADYEYILTDSEKEAAFLENNFVRQYQPKFNLRLKDDKSFPYLKLTLQEKYPGIYLTRRVEADGARYFGPFSPAHQARKTIQLINRHFGVRGCEEVVPGKRKRPCLEYDLKLCTAPCVGSISEQEYKEGVNNALLFLEGKVDRLLKILKIKMKQAAQQEEFEQAAHWRNLIWTIDQIKDKPKLISVDLEDKDIFGFSWREDKAALYIFQMRGGKVSESEGIILEGETKTSQADLLSSSLFKFYSGQKDLPAKILLPSEPSNLRTVLKRILADRQQRVGIFIPRKGKNKKLVDLANRNAGILLEEESVSPLEESRRVLGLESIPSRIEGFDVSNISGTETVASLVVFENGRPKKNEYRKYVIRTVRGPNDIASLQEAIQRRYTRVLREEKALPDLILVDGGKGQLNAAKRVLDDLNLGPLPVVSLAKKEETLFISPKKHGLKLDRTSPTLKLFQRIRDEAHRFAVAFHRLRRAKKSFASPLDDIPGIGPIRRTLLLGKYKSLQEIRRAPPAELAQLIGPKAAKELKARLK